MTPSMSPPVRRPRASRLRRAPALALAAALLLAGCAASRPPATLVTLPAVVPVGAPASTLAAGAPVLAVRRIGLPEYLETRRVRYRNGEATLTDWNDAYWAERFEIAAAREFAAALREALPGWTLCENACADHAPRYVLQAEWTALDYQRARQTLEGRARWQLEEPGTGTATRLAGGGERGFTLAVAQDSPQGQALATRALLRELAQAVAQGMPPSAVRP